MGTAGVKIILEELYKVKGAFKSPFETFVLVYIYMRGELDDIILFAMILPGQEIGHFEISTISWSGQIILLESEMCHFCSSIVFKTIVGSHYFRNSEMCHRNYTKGIDYPK